MAIERQRGAPEPDADPAPPLSFALEGPANRRMMVVVTVESPRGRTTLAAPDDLPVQQLLPALVEACRCEQEAARWSLRARGEGPLAPEQTLNEAGVYRGAILELKAEEPPTGPARRHLASWAEVGLYHARRTGVSLRARTREKTPNPRPTAAARSTAAPRNAPAERQRPDPDSAISTARFQRGLLIAVLGGERGAGATTVAALLATLLAHLRPDRVTAMDTDVVSGSLSLWLTPGRRIPAADLESAVAQGRGAGALRPQLVGERHGLLVLPAPMLGGGGGKLDQPFYAALVAHLTAWAELAVVDCGAAETAAARASLVAADIAVVVCPPEDPDSRRVEQALQAARTVCRSVVLVTNRVQRSRASNDGRARMAGADNHFALSDEPAAAARLRAAAFDWQAAPKSWQAELRALGAALLLDRSSV
ncbi:MAG: EsaB/YukD family protein [Candidatus Dormibacteraeota bacterium]|nr:EsaB/YukD family protein [Candidatus Dormibacteraeota bacterium]